MENYRDFEIYKSWEMRVAHNHIADYVLFATNEQEIRKRIDSRYKKL